MRLSGVRRQIKESAGALAARGSPDTNIRTIAFGPVATYENSRMAIFVTAILLKSVCSGAAGRNEVSLPAGSVSPRGPELAPTLKSTASCSR
jgi:hypothetical protein